MSLFAPYSFFEQKIVAAGPAPETPNPVTSGRILQLTAQPSSYAGTGTTWFDQSGNDFDFAILGSPTWDATDGFDLPNNNNKYMQLSNTTLNNYFAGLTNQNSLTLFVQHKPTAADGADRALIQARYFPTEADYFYFGVDGVETMDLSIGAPVPLYEYRGSTTGTITNGVSQVAIMTVGTNAITAYVDNVALTGTVGMSSNTYPSSNNQNWTIGVFTTGGGSRIPYNGKLKSVVVYNRVLNSSERGDVVSWLQSI